MPARYLTEGEAADSAGGVEPLRAPFPWFGGKSRAASLIWERFGDVPNYVEPFAGSLAVMLARPTVARVETVNDLDCYLANFWRAVSVDAEAVARYADWPVNEADISARHQWLVDRSAFRERMKTDPDFHDAKIAGWWVWGLCGWIGSGWCDSAKYRDGDGVGGAAVDGRGVGSKLPHLGNHGRGVHREGVSGVGSKLPYLSNLGQGVHREGVSGVPQQLPHLANLGQGVHREGVSGVVRKLPSIGDYGKGVHRSGGEGFANERVNFASTAEWFAALQQRLRRVRVACGDWRRILGGSTIGTKGGLPTPTAVLLDPPYDDGDMKYATGDAPTSVSADVRAWALAHGDDRRLRIALCGYEGEHPMPATWRAVAWKSKGGFAGQGSAENVNARRERIWFSPHCLDPDRGQGSLF